MAKINITTGSGELVETINTADMDLTKPFAQQNLLQDVLGAALWADRIERAALAHAAILCCTRPTTLKVDENGVSHCDDGPAIEFGDGLKIWACHGHTVNEEFIMRPQDQGLSQIRGEPNAELKRIRIERYAGRDKSPAEGWMRYLCDTEARCIDRRRNDIENVEEALFQTREREVVLVCACPSTARVYALEVPYSRRTVERAQAYLHSRAKMDRGGPPNVIGRS